MTSEDGLELKQHSSQMDINDMQQSMGINRSQKRYWTESEVSKQFNQQIFFLPYFQK